MPATALTFAVLETSLTSGFGEWSYEYVTNTAKRTWTLTASRDMIGTDYDAGDVALLALPVAVGGAYKTGDIRRCKKITIKAIAGDPRGLYAEAEFEPGEFEENPLLRPDTISLQIDMENQDWFKDDDDKPVVTSAGEIFDKIPPRTSGNVKLIITGNRAALPAMALVTQSRPSNINSSGFTVRGISIGARQAKIGPCSGTNKSENGVDFYEVRWELELAPDWSAKLDDRGFVKLVAVGDETDPDIQAPIMVGEPPEQTKKPWPLDGNGNIYTDPTAEPAVLTFKPYPASFFDYGWTASA